MLAMYILYSGQRFTTWVVHDKNRGGDQKTLAEKTQEAEVCYNFVSPGQTDSQVHTSQYEFAKPELAYSMDLWWKWICKSACKFTQVAKCGNFHAYTVYSWLATNFVLTCVGRPNGGEKLVSTCVWIWAWPKSMQVITSPCKWMAKRKLNATCIDLRVCLALWLIIYYYNFPESTYHRLHAKSNAWKCNLVTPLCSVLKLFVLVIILWYFDIPTSSSWLFSNNCKFCRLYWWCRSPPSEIY